MTPRTPAAAALRAIADDLMEAMSLARTAPHEAIRRADAAINAMVEAEAMTARAFIGPFALLREGQEALSHDGDPGPLEAACAAAARLLQGIAARIEGEGEDV